MKSQRIQAEFIRKREIEQRRVQETQNVRQYYDKMGRITSLHQHWSSPEFYEEVEEKRKAEKLVEEKRKELEARKERFRAQLAEEKRQFELELKEQKKPRSRQTPNSVLESVRQTLANAEECKARADLESKLYSRWRLGLDHEKILKDSKNTHQAMAKLSWIDRQIENQMLNEQQKQESHKLELELEHEKRKHEAYLQNCQQMRDSEINKIKDIHGNGIVELKLREQELHESKLKESILRKKLGEVIKEKETISTTNVKRRDRVAALHNFRKIKMLMRERSEAVKRDLMHDISLLDRISFDRDFDNDEEIKYLRLKFQGQLDNESENVKSIECMYESEAKEALRKTEDKWDEEALLREQQLKVLMDDRIQTLNDRINECIRMQNDLTSIRETHLKSIEDCNLRLKELMSESLTSGLNDMARKTIIQTDPILKNDNHLNGIVRKTDNLMINGHHYELTVPKYGRKKVNWN
ncbi:hypothetical protein ACKWTF_000967 [Chironomus riparius]